MELGDLVTRRTDGDPHHLRQFPLVRILLPQHHHATLCDVFRLRKVGPVRHQPSERKAENPLADRPQISWYFRSSMSSSRTGSIGDYCTSRSPRKNIIRRGCEISAGRKRYTVMSLFATKSISRILSESEAGAHRLKRTLGPVQLVALGIGAIIGAGLFSLTGVAAAQNSGPAVILSMVIAAIGCAFAGLCYSEFSCMIPVAGSAYTYAYATLGEWIAWIIGWDLVIEYAIGSATVSISWSAYVVSLLHAFHINLPAQWIAGPFETVELPDGTMAQGYANIPAVIIVFLVSLLLMVGIKESARTNAVIVAIKLAVVLVFIGVGWSYINPANYKPFLPPNTGEFGSFGISGLMMGAGTIFFAYIGFDAVSTAAQECRNPQRDMPIGIIGSLVVCTVLYLLFGTGADRHGALHETRRRGARSRWPSPEPRTSGSTTW